MNAHLQRALDEVEAATGRLSVEEIARPVPGRWSVAEILEHLTLAFTVNVRALEKALASGDPKAGRPTPSQWLSRVLVVDIGYFPRARAPENVTPHGSIPPETSRSAIRDALATLDATLERAAARFGERQPLLKHAFFGGMTVPQWRVFHFRHARHHMRQVRRISGELSRAR